MTQEKLVLCFLLLAMIVGDVTTDTTLLPSVSEPSNPADVTILVLVGQNFGKQVFDAIDIFESWGCKVYTAGTEPEVESCPMNPPTKNITVDYDIADIGEAFLQNIDCIFIPPGPHTGELKPNTDVARVLQIAQNNSLVLSGICTGSGVIARNVEVENGTKVASSKASSITFVNQGCTVVYNASVVCDGRLVTGKGGGGLTGGGYIVAPSFETCSAIIKTALNLSYVIDATLEPLRGPAHNYRVIVNADNLSSISETIFNRSVAYVNAEVYCNGTRIGVYRLHTSDNSTFTGEINGLAAGSYNISIDAWDSADILEVHRTVFTIEVDAYNTTTTTTNNNTSSLGVNSSTPLIVGAVLIGIVGVTVIILWKRNTT